MEIKTAAIIGLGLIGGSLAKALRKVKGIEKILGVDSDARILEAAIKEGVLDKGTHDISEQLNEADIVFICTPLGSIVESMERLIKIVKPHCILTDTGSIKNEIISNVEKISGSFDFIGGHPMCGSEKHGYYASKAHLFENAYYILTPCSKTRDDTTTKLEKIFIEIGAIPVIIDSRKHDIITGTISHVPHVISAALVNLVKESDYQEEYMKRLAAGGFKDITRISSSKPEMWQSVVINNKEDILKILDSFTDKLNEFKKYIVDNQNEKILDYFRNAKEYRDSISSLNTGLLAPFHDLTVDIVDKPGEIANIATLLSKDDINIKNINVSNNRENEAGCLRITLSSVDGVKKAHRILSTYGYKTYEE